MKIYKSQYGYSSTAYSNRVDGSQIKCYIDINYKKGEEPLMEETEGKLIFREEDGSERECFFSCYEKKGVVVPKLVMMGKSYTQVKKKDTPNSVQTVLSDGKKNILGHTEVDPTIDLDPDELPFY